MANCFCKDCNGQKAHGGTPVVNPIDLSASLSEGIVLFDWDIVNRLWDESQVDGMGSFLFDRDIYVDPDGIKRFTWKLKKTIGGIKHTIGKENGRCVVERYEGVVSNGRATVETQAAAGATQIVLSNPEVIGGLNANVSILITGTGADGKGAPIKAEVASVAADEKTITLKQPLADVVPAGACVIRLVFNGSFDGCEFDGTDTVKFKGEVRRYFSHFRFLQKDIVLEANKCFINTPTLKDYVMGDASKATSMVEMLKDEYRTQVHQLYQEFMHTFWMDNNIVDADGKVQTMGYFNEIQKYNDENGNPLNVIDVSACCVAGDCESVTNMIYTFLEEVHGRMAKSYKGMKPEVTLLVNSAQYNALKKLRPYFEALDGTLYTAERRNGEMLSSNLNIFSFDHMGTKIHFQYERSLDMYFSDPIAILMPEDSVGVVQLTRHGVNGYQSDGTPIFTEHTGVLNRGELNLVIDKNTKARSRLSQCEHFKMYLEYAFVILYADKCVHLIVRGLESCEALGCSSCDDYKLAPANPLIR